MSEQKWQTAITKIEPNNIQLRGYAIHELMGSITFAQGVYLALKGELPDENTGRIMDAILVSSIDHGVTPPSAQTAVTVASTGSPINASVAAGILAISSFHGGAIEECMNMLLTCVKLQKEKNISAEKAASEVLDEFKKNKKRASGFGHRVHTEDPRSVKLFSMADNLGVSGEHVTMAKAVETTLEKSLGKKLPINVDGAIAALLCEMGFPPSIANAFFMMSRLPGLVAHVYEEQTRYKPMRKIDFAAHEYDGPENRKLQEKVK